MSDETITNTPVWVVDLGYPFTDMNDWGRYDESLEAFAMEHSGHGVSAGTGFGVRDSQFEFAVEADADAFADQVVKTFKDLEYLSVFFESGEEPEDDD